MQYLIGSYQASFSIHFFRLTIERLENEKKEIQHELHIYKQQSSGTQVNICIESPTTIVISDPRKYWNNVLYLYWKTTHLNFFPWNFSRKKHTANLLAEKFVD